MISLAPPYHVIGGYSVLPDHADPRRWYVLPTAPGLARTPDGRPAFSLVQFLGGGAGAAKVAGGLLTLSTELYVPDEDAAALRAALGPLTGQAPASLELLPVLFDSGTVELVALGRPSAPADPAPAPAAAAPDPGPFAVQVLGSGRASLGGRNTATFQLVLDEQAAELVAQALDAPELPIIATYRLGFVGLRPSFSVRVQGDWAKVYHSLQQALHANLYYVAADLDQHISRALEDGAVTVDVTVLGSGESEAAAAERARQQLTDWVLERLFAPVPDPSASTGAAVAEAVGGAVSGLVRRLVPGVRYTLRVLDEQQARTLSARLDEAVAEKRDVLPQGTLGGLLRALREDPAGRERPEWPALRRSLVTPVNLDGFPRLEVQVSSEDRFATDGVAEVRVELARVGPQGAPLEPRRTVALRSAGQTETYVVNLLGHGGPGDAPAFARLYQYRVEARFDPAGPFGPHEPVGSGWQRGATGTLVVEPRTVYGVQDVQLSAAPGFPFAQFPVVTAELRYDGEPGVPQLGRVELTAPQPSATWRFRTFQGRGPASPPGPRPEGAPYQVALTYHREGGGAPLTPAPRLWTDDYVSVPDPLPVRRLLNVFVALPWAQIVTAYVQVRYRDDASGLHFDEQLTLAADTPFVHREYPLAPGAPTTLAYRLTVLTTSGSLLEGSWRETEDDRLVIDRRLVDRRAVQVRAVGGELSAARLQEVRVQLQRRAPQGQVQEQTEVTFTRGAPPAPAVWEVMLGDPPVKTVYYSAAFVDDAGFVTHVPWTATDADLLVVQLKSRTVTA